MGRRYDIDIRVSVENLGECVLIGAAIGERDKAKRRILQRPARYVPIFPGITMKVDDFTLTKDFEAIDWEGCKVKWTTHADNAPPHSGEIAIKDIEIVDRRDIDPDELDFDDDEGLDE